jgi:hypothetical protein
MLNCSRILYKVAHRARHFATVRHEPTKSDAALAVWVGVMCGSLWWMVEYPPIKRDDPMMPAPTSSETRANCADSTEHNSLPCI